MVNRVCTLDQLLGGNVFWCRHLGDVSTGAARLGIGRLRARFCKHASCRHVALLFRWPALSCLATRAPAILCSLLFLLEHA
jgi:hypothetical protein